MNQQLTIEDLKANAGQPWLTLTYTIEYGMVQRFIEAVGDENPRWQGKKPEAPPALLVTKGFERVISMLLRLPEAAVSYTHLTLPTIYSV